MNFTSTQLLLAMRFIANNKDIILCSFNKFNAQGKISIDIISHNDTFDSIEYIGESLDEVIKKGLDEYIFHKKIQKNVLQKFLFKNYCNRKFDQYNNEIISLFEQLGKMGYLVLYKIDGLRNKNQYTVMLNSEKDNVKNNRFDAPSFREAVAKSLQHVPFNSLKSLSTFVDLEILIPS